MTSCSRAALLVALLIMSSSISAQGDDAVSLLRGNDCSRLESSLSAVQNGFEKGEVNEYQLRNAFRPFYNLDALAEKNLIDCAARLPKSYVMHLALGVHYKHLGGDARGEKYVSDTPQQNLEKADHYYGLAVNEFEASMDLTKKPFLSVFYLFDITGHQGDSGAAKALLARGNAAFPGNTLVRAKYAVYLLPRWGGSYAQFDDFIASSAREGAPAVLTLELQAIESNDKAQVLEENGDRAAAGIEYQKALRLGQQAGGTFSVDFLAASHMELCDGPNRSPYCR